jgi:hypothetical protein
MANYKVEVDGTTVSNVIDVSTQKPDSGSIGEAKITVGNSDTNRGLFVPGAEVVVKIEDPDNPGTFETDWRGDVVSKPSNTAANNLSLEVTAETTSAQAEYAKVTRPFIERTNSEIIEKAVAEIVDPEPVVVDIHKAESTTDWSHNFDEFELMDTVSDIVRDGDDALYFGIPPGTSGTLYAEYTGGPTVTGRRLDVLETRFLLADKGAYFDAFVYLVDGSGIQYKWAIETSGRAENVLYELAVEDADEITTSADYPNGTLRYEFVTDGNIPDERALMIDSATAVEFKTETRSTDLTTDVEATTRKATRRLNDSILNIADEFATEDGFTAYVDTANVLNYKRSGSTAAPVSIDYSTNDAQVVDVAVDRDFDVRNVVTIQGKDDLRETFESTQSIDFYNVRSPKEEPIDDPTIRTEAGLRRRARGFLSDEAFNDGAIVFTVGNPDFRDVVPGQLMTVDWPPEGLDDDYVVGSVGRTTEGYTTISLSGNVSL